jgi:hypothetical protein
MSLAELTGGPSYSSRSVVLRARVTRAPATPADALSVVALNYSSGHDYEVPAGQWWPYGTDVPVVGSTCVLLLDDDGDAWVPIWSPGG